MPHRPPTHRSTQRRDGRPSATARGYNARWRRESMLYLRAQPRCECCRTSGRLTLATVVDHLIPHKGNSVLFWDVGNWQSLCKSCHDRKTATSDGGFGHAGSSN